MRKITSLDLANTMMLYEMDKLNEYKHLMSDKDIASDLQAIKRTYLEKSGWESLFYSEIRKQGYQEYIPELIAESSQSRINTDSRTINDVRPLFCDNFFDNRIEEELEEEMELEL